jgi:hypothetical protein
MQSNPTGPYFSPLLLYTLQAQASRHLVTEEGWSYVVSWQDDQADCVGKGQLITPQHTLRASFHTDHPSSTRFVRPRPRNGPS